MYIVADIGGTKTRVAGSRDLEKFDEPIIFDTPQEYADGLVALEAAIRKVAGTEKIESIAAAIAGVLSREKHILLGARHLPFWKNRDLKADIERIFDTTMFLENDTAQVGLGEALYGAGKGVKIVVYITVSTGVGGVPIIDGTITPAALGFEIGGQYLSIGDAPRSLEDLISGKAISEKYGVVSPKMIDKDSPVWEELAKYTGYGVHNTILHWSPHRVVLGGSMFNEIGIKVDRVQAHVQRVMKKFPDVPEIVHSSLGDLGGLWGGLAILTSRRG
ncbi:MAG: ROK family protein [bacterium]|nr:ROK family protein [bacterium]